MAVATVIHLSLVVTAISVCVCSAVISKMKLSENDIWSGEKGSFNSKTGSVNLNIFTPDPNSKN